MKKETQERKESPASNGAHRTLSDREGLMQTNTQYQHALEGQFSDLKSQAESWMKGAAVVGGVIFVGYSFYKVFIEKDDESEKSTEEPKVALTPVHNKNESSIVRMIKESIALFLIEIAKEKIQQFLQSLESEYKNGDTPSTK